MGGNFMRVMFGERALELQEADGSRKGYSRMMERGEGPDPVTANEAAFLAECDSFYMASVSKDGWPYVQHRGGPKGFLKVLDEHTIGFADFGGNRQFISAANIDDVGRVSLFLMDYPRRARLKIIGNARWEEASYDHPLYAQLVDEAYLDERSVRPQRFFIIDNGDRGGALGLADFGFGGGAFMT